MNSYKPSLPYNLKLFASAQCTHTSEKYFSLLKFVTATFTFVLIYLTFYISQEFVLLWTSTTFLRTVLTLKIQTFY